MADHKWVALGSYRYVCEICGSSDVYQTCGSQGITPERQALLDIVELIDNQYDDLYVLRMVDQIAKKVLNENT